HVYIPGTSYDATTNSNGNFTISNVAEGTYALRAERTNFGTITMNDIPVESSQDSGIDPFMLPSVVGNVTGIARLEVSPYTGILITLRKDVGTTYLTTTDANGNYAFVDVPVGEYTLIATMPGYLPQQNPLTVQAGLEPNKPSDLFLPLNNNKGSLTGTITLDNLSDYSGILVSLAGTGYLAVTDSTGAYTISDIPESTYTVFMKAEGYGAENVGNVQITSDQTTTLSARTLIAATGTPNGTIVGNALYLDETVHSGILISIEPNPTGIAAAATDTNGGFIIKNVLTGTYTLSFANYPAYKTVVRRGVHVFPWNTTFIRPVQMIPPVGSIRGTVAIEGSLPNDDIYTDVNIYAAYDPEGTSATTHPSQAKGGEFLLENVKEGIVTIVATKPGFNSATVLNVKVLPGQTAIIEESIVLTTPPVPPTGVTASQASGSSVNVEWTDSTSDDVAGYNVYYSKNSSQINNPTNTTLITGTSFEVTGLSKGVTYYFAVEAVDDDGLISVLSQYAWTEIVPGAPVPPEPSEIAEGGFPFIIPEAICLSRDGQRAYVTNPGNNVVSLIDLATAAVMGTIVVGQHPYDLAANPVKDEVYCVNKDNDTITVIDSTQADPEQAVIGTLNTADAPVRCLVSPDGKYLFVSCVGAGADSITVIDLDAGSEIEGSPIFVGTDPQGMAIANNKLYVANEWDNNVSVIDIDPASSNRWLKLAYNITVGDSPEDLATNQDGSFVYVVNSGSDTVSVIDTATDQVINSLTVGDYPFHMAASGNMLYVTNYIDGNISMINMNTNTVLSTTFGVGNYPQGIAVTADGETIYVVNNGSESVSIRTY
ncbi:carboxypeptidase regulatory-like domain-containing protein, partial [bacterium]|nr:carboxypeptidase regulatory-like domain-containing protein [bacterium]